MKSRVPSSFESIPVLNNQNATFYYFIDERDKDDIDELWILFESALKYAENSNKKNKSILSEYFDLAINKKGNGNSKITMGLYWISPESFLNLDAVNINYIYYSGEIPRKIVLSLPIVKDKISSDDYFNILEKIHKYLQSDGSHLNNLKELSLAAWKYSEEQKQTMKNNTDITKKDRLLITSLPEKGSGLADEDVTVINHWVYSPGHNASKWQKFYAEGIMGIGWDEIGDLSKYTKKDEISSAMKAKFGSSSSHRNAVHATWEFVHAIKPGDVIYVKKGRTKIIGRGVITSDYFYDESIDDDYANFRLIDWTHDFVDEPLDYPGMAPNKTLTNITQFTNILTKLTEMFETDEDIVVDNLVTYPEYDKLKFLNEVYLDEKDYDILVGLIRNKKNVILQGAPGVGKTFAAKRLAYSMIGSKDQDRVMMVQFHQSYSYEDFIEGFRPSSTGNSFEIKKGSFYNFCKKAADDEDNEYFFIIDEINRGNLSKIFGELFMLIENDKRGNELQLLYSDEKFAVPQNLYIIGMLNAADRSLALLDYALRRRFAFYEMRPGFDSKGFNEYANRLNDSKFNKLVEHIKDLNVSISEDDSLGEGFCIGHSYFCGFDTLSSLELNNIVEFEIIPLLKEYWFDEPTKLKSWSDRLRGAIA